MPVQRLRRCRTGGLEGLTRAVALGLALALLVTGCGGDPKKPAAAGKGPSTEISSSSSKPPAPAEPAPDPGFQAPKLGQCYRMLPAQSRASVAKGARVGCRRRHNTVVGYVGFVPKAVTPNTPLSRRRALGKRVCDPAYRRLAGGTLADRATSILTWTLFTPGQAQLERGARWVRCDVLARSGNKLVSLPTGQPLLERGVPEQLRVCQDEAGLDLSCSEPHVYRVEAVYQAVGEPYPAGVSYISVARERCRELTGKPGGYWQPPSRSGWSAGDRFIRCLSPDA